MQIQPFNIFERSFELNFHIIKLCSNFSFLKIELRKLSITFVVHDFQDKFWQPQVLE